MTDDEVPAMERQHRRQAHEDAASGREEAAAIHDRAAAFMEGHDDPDNAARHRALAVVARCHAVEEHQKADEYRG